MLVLFKAGVDINGYVPRFIGVTGKQGLSLFGMPCGQYVMRVLYSLNCMPDDLHILHKCEV